MSGFPIVLVDLANTPCVVIGGGEVAARKAAALSEAGARPVVISPSLCEALEHQAQRGEIDVILRAYQPGDLAGARLAIAATNDAATNQAVWREAQMVGCLINVVDDPGRCNFYIPATVRRGALTIGISTAGRSPALAARIRQDLESRFGEEYSALVDILGELRERTNDLCPPGKRRDLWYALVDSDMLELLREGKEQEARETAASIVNACLRE